MSIRKQLRPFEQKNTTSAIWQLANTLPLVILLLVVQFYTYENLNLAFWFITTPLLVLVASRLFIIFHDCGHHNWLKNRTSNIVIGHILGFVLFTPYTVWRYFHNLHHNVSGNLDERSRLDIKMLTLAEYQELTKREKLFYRLSRSLIARYFLVVPLIFLIGLRIPHHIFSKDGVLSIFIYNFLYIFSFWLISHFYPLKDLFIILLPVYWLYFCIGGFLFFIQHQFEDAYWENAEEWDFEKAAIHGSSFWNVGSLLHWLTGYIGYHHIHHLDMGIPNYNLAKAHESVFRNNKEIRKIGLIESLTLPKYKLWDEGKKKMIGFP